jgi:hypothetical protein
VEVELVLLAALLHLQAPEQYLFQRLVGLVVVRVLAL